MGRASADGAEEDEHREASSDGEHRQHGRAGGTGVERTVERGSQSLNHVRPP